MGELVPGETVSFLCPFCGLKCEAGNHVISGLPTPVYGVVHVAPMCETFKTNEPTEFLASVNRERGGRGRSLGEQFPLEQARVRKILSLYKELGAPGSFGALMIEQVIQRADKAAVEQDVVAMLQSFQEMQEIKE